MKNKKLFISTIIFASISLLFTILLLFVDIQKIGPLESKVGFASFNNSFRNLIGNNDTMYSISKYTGIIILLIAVAYCILALIQAIKRKSIKSVEKELLFFVLFCIGFALIYIFFELIQINFRPVLNDGKLEASYPSSHTMISIFICSLSIFLNTKLINNKKISLSCNIFVGVLGGVTIICRILSGVHWATDIIGGILIATTLVLGYIYTCKSYSKNENTN